MFVALGLSPFILIECALRIFDAGADADTQDPFAGFNAQNPLFEKHGEVYRTSRFRGQYFSEQEFAAIKPADEFRIFCLGGSTVYGQPFHAPTAFPQWLEIELNGRRPASRVKVVNCGGISYATHRLLHIVREVAQYQPDLIVLAAGHNEFLEDRTYYSLKSQSTAGQLAKQAAFSLRTVALARRWLGKDETAPLAATSDQGPPQKRIEDVSTRLDDTAGFASFKRDEQWQARVIGEYEMMIPAIAAACDEAAVPLILVNLGSNLRDCPPFKSEHRADISPDDERRWQDAFNQAEELESTDPGAALEAYRSAEALDPDYALLLYRMARIFDRQGEHDAALDYFIRAKEADVCPLRMLEQLNTILLQFAGSSGTPIVDLRGELERTSPQGIPGFDRFVDHVHPGIGGHQRLAQMIAPVISRENFLEVPLEWAPNERRAAYSEHISGLPMNYFKNGSRRLEWLDAWAGRQRLLLETAPRDAPGFLRQGMRRYEFGDEADAWESFSTALETDPSIAQALMQYAGELRGQGRSELALKLIDRLAGTPRGKTVKSELEKFRATLITP